MMVSSCFFITRSAVSSRDSFDAAWSLWLVLRLYIDFRSHLSRFVLKKMAKVRGTRRRIASRHIRLRPYKFPSANRVVGKSRFAEECPKLLEKRDWEDVICSVCMECPHNAVLLLCSSHDKGCRPYMCGTSFRYSNCLDEYKKASAKLMPPSRELPTSNTEFPNLTCPLCRGQVKGWTIVQPARDYLNLKTRSCMQENCSFMGTFKELREHMKMVHPSARPREVDPSVEQKWRRLELERDRDDVISTIRTTMPGAMVLGDYVIERNTYRSDSDEGDDDNDNDDDDGQRNEGGISAGLGRNLVNVFLLLHAFGPSGNQTRSSDFAAIDLTSDTTRDLASDANGNSDSSGQEDGGFSNYDYSQSNEGMSLASRLRRRGRILMGRSSRRRRNRES
ncbi:PREDICTED: uncharacterized protein LOC104807954 isoform X3 [Tarenaya hassleriana]|uniref:uncharacterized protein LOC104807954 isoform X3 n=1 Tax=Tarenaya hassleriana TaxID=28532 RepID=UPI00053C4F18|nr:PREDICTED: uncharacterized protein LOC104807954 isoform X3 [Tarenaya hassleriana]